MQLQVLAVCGFRVCTSLRHLQPSAPPPAPLHCPPQAACLARCNGARVELYPFGSVGVAQFRAMVAEACRTAEEHIIVSYSRKEFLQTGGRGRGCSALRRLARSILQALHSMPCQSTNGGVWACLIASHNTMSTRCACSPALRAGDGHFSPIGGYSAREDLVLILDTARFKYPPHWVPLEMLYR